MARRRRNADRALTANRLTDGVVVFLAEDGRWSVTLEDAAVVSDEARAEELEALGNASEAANQVVGVYWMAVEQTQHGWRPTRLRERIRALGPTVCADLTRPRGSAQADLPRAAADEAN